jgi:hypothetical protein
MAVLGKGTGFPGCALLAASFAGGVEDVGGGRSWPRHMSVWKSCPSRRRDLRTRWDHKLGEYFWSEKREERREADWRFFEDTTFQSSKKAK